MDDFTLERELESIDARHGGWDEYKTDYFLKLDRNQRATELAIFQSKMNEEARPTKQFAEYFSKYRSLADLDKLLRESGR